MSVAHASGRRFSSPLDTGAPIKRNGTERRTGLEITEPGGFRTVVTPHENIVNQPT